MDPRARVDTAVVLGADPAALLEDPASTANEARSRAE